MISPSTIKSAKNEIVIEYRPLTYLSAVSDYTLLGSSPLILQAITESNEILQVPSLNLSNDWFLTMYFNLAASVLVPDVGANYQFSMPLKLMNYGTTFFATNPIKIDGQTLQKSFMPNDPSCQIPITTSQIDARNFDIVFAFNWNSVYSVGMPAAFDYNGAWQVQAVGNIRLIASQKWLK